MRQNKMKFKRLNLKKNFTFLGFLGATGLVVTLFPDFAHAASSGGNGMPYDTWFQTIRESLRGNVAHTIMFFAIVSAGVTLYLKGGEMNEGVKALLGLVILGVFLVGAEPMMSSLFNTSATIPL